MCNWYKLTLEQIQPIHLGLKKHGVINETRIFISGQTMWGALTNAYGKKNNWKDSEYDQNKDLFAEISCFYPLIDDKLKHPCYKSGEFYLGEYSEIKFKQKFTATYLSTAINPYSLNANDESLHELEVIIPHYIDKTGKLNNLKWQGYVKLKDDSKITELSDIYVGGEQKYGFGLMKITSKTEITSETDSNSTLDAYINLKKGKAENYKKTNECIYNFVKFNSEIKFEGKTELIAEFKFNKNKPQTQSADLYITPGSKIL